MMIKTEHFRAVGGFDERLAIGFNDTDLCLKLHNLGLRNLNTRGPCCIITSPQRGLSIGRSRIPKTRSYFTKNGAIFSVTAILTIIRS